MLKIKNIKDWWKNSKLSEKILMIWIWGTVFIIWGISPFAAYHFIKDKSFQDCLIETAFINCEEKNLTYAGHEIWVTVLEKANNSDELTPFYYCAKYYDNFYKEPDVSNYFFNASEIKKCRG